MTNIIKPWLQTGTGKNSATVKSGAIYKKPRSLYKLCKRVLSQSLKVQGGLGTVPTVDRTVLYTGDMDGEKWVSICLD